MSQEQVPFPVHGLCGFPLAHDHPNIILSRFRQVRGDGQQSNWYILFGFDSLDAPLKAVAAQLALFGLLYQLGFVLAANSRTSPG